jgi:tRNA(Ile)-lysidine synthase
MTAHHFDDQMETFFMHLSRKSGLTGLTCMAEQNGNHQRPLLNYSKQELKDFAVEKEIKWREDASNQENKYLRTKWRNEWLPLLKNQLPNLEENVRVLITAFQQERNRLEVEFSPKTKEIKNSTNWSFTDFDTCSNEAKYIISKELGLRYAEMERLIELRETEKSKFFELNRLNLRIWHDGDKFTFEKIEKYLLPSLRIERISQLPKIFDKNTYFADSNKVVGQLKIRFWKEGDRIASIGLSGTQLISGIIKDAKIPSSEKKKVFIVEDDEKILWCVGLKVGRDRLADENSEDILMVNLNF